MLGGWQALRLKNCLIVCDFKLPSFIASLPPGHFVNIGTQNVVGNQVKLAIF